MIGGSQESIITKSLLIVILYNLLVRERLIFILRFYKRGLSRNQVRGRFFSTHVLTLKSYIAAFIIHIETARSLYRQY